MKILTFKVGVFQTNTFIVHNNNIGFVIDPGCNASDILNIIEINEIKITHIFLTHGHYDHIMASNIIAQKTNSKIIMHKSDITLLKKEMILQIMPDINNLYEYIEPKIDSYAYDANTYQSGDLIIKVIHTPGHTEGSVVYKINNYLFTGDTLFKLNCGRCDLIGGDYKKLLSSLQKLSRISGNSYILPGHGEITTLDFERLNNIHMQNTFLNEMRYDI